ncbi:MAG: hypothetical protein NWE85_02395 [Candidatus Bathyarchaeota archaeon]|nr:hypothetical protein [Candidatus Bathyarchaeota archaeon]
MVAVVNAEIATLQGIMKGVTFTSVALNKEVTKLVANARNFPVQCL